MNVENFKLTPDPAFIKLLSQYFPHEHRTSRLLPNGNIQDEVLPGTNFMEDVMRVYQTLPTDKSIDSFADWHIVEHSMWTQPYVEEVKGFLKANNLNADLLANIWLLRCRMYFELDKARWTERNRHNYDSEQLKNINFIKNKVLPFIKQLQGDKYLTNGHRYVHSVSFKSKKPGIETLKLEGHLADNMYSALQEMAYSFLKANEHFKPDILTNRLKAGIATATKGSYQVLRQWGTFGETRTDKPSSNQLRVLEDLINLGFNSDDILARISPNKPVEEYLRCFFY